MQKVFSIRKKRLFVIFMQERDYFKQVTINILDMQSSIIKPNSVSVWYCTLSKIYAVYFSYILPTSLTDFHRVCQFI